MVSLFLFYCENGLLKQCENTVVSWGARGPGDLGYARTGAERRPNPSLATKTRRNPKGFLFLF